MINALANILHPFYRYYVLSISIINSETKYYIMQLLFKNNELVVEERYAFDDFKSKAKSLKKYYPIILHVEGDSIINKCVENKSGYRKNLIFKANLDDFYFYEYKQDEKIYASIARKTIIDEHLDEIKALNFNIIHLTFGAFVMANLIPFLQGNTVLSSTNYTLNLSDDKLRAFNTEGNINSEYSIQGDIFNANEIPLIGAFFNLKIPNELIEFDTEFLQSEKEEFKYRRLFNIAGVFALVFILSSLITSHFLLDSYLQSLAEKQNTYALHEQTSLKIDALSAEKKLKERILSSSGMNSDDYITKFIADIGNSVPGTITLEKISVNPILKKIKPKEEVRFNFNVIEITGSTSNDKAFNTWIKDVRHLNWIKKVEILDYIQEQRHLNTFKIKVVI